MQVQLVVVHQVFEQSDKETDSTPSQMRPETFNPLIGDGCAIPMTSSSVPTQEHLYRRHGSVLRPTIRPQNLGTDGDFRQAEPVT